MKTDIVAIRESERLALNLLTSPFSAAAQGTAGAVMGQQLMNQYPGYANMLNPALYYIGNQFYTDPRLVTMPATLQQELPFTNAGTYEFNFSSTNAVGPSATLNNFILPQNNVAACYGVRLRIGYGALGNTRVYQCFGNTAADNSIYNSNIILTIESENQVTNFFVDDFKDVPDNSPNEINKYNGVMLMNPVRLISGKLGVFTMTIKTLSSISALSLSDDAFLSLTLLCAFGQASGGPPIAITGSNS